MRLAHIKQVCLDTNDLHRSGRFWSEVLSRQWRRDADYPGGDVFGDDAQLALRLELVEEPKTGKNRIHPDIYARSISDVEAAGATVVLPEAEDRRWTVMADPDGNEFCVFVRERLGSSRIHGVGIDCGDPAALAAWWGGVLDSTVTDNPRGFSTVEPANGRSFTLDFNAVAEPKTVKNRMHWDVYADVSRLLDAGARLLREPHDDAYWHVLADPQGNEFCAFPGRPPAVRL
jgi:predicted enzyme related to lactoylglutathione lyase